MRRWTAVLSRTGWTVAGLAVVLWLGSSPEFAPHASAQRGDLLQKTGKTAPAKTATKSATKSAKPAAKKMPAPNNPLGRLIRGLFPKKQPGRILPNNNGGIAKTMPKDPAKKTTGNGDPHARDHIDRRAPFDQDDARRLSRAERFVENKNWKLARTLLQRLLDRAEDSLIRNSKGEWVSVRDEATRLLGKFPSDQLDAYRLQFGKPAELLLETAIEQGDMRRIVDVATRYFRTPAGHQAANLLASWYLDREEYGMSARWLRRLLAVEAKLTNDPKWKLKAAMVFQNAGDPALSESLVKSVERTVGTDGVDLGGKKYAPREWLKNAVHERSLRHKPLEEWPVFFGSPSRTGTAAGGDPLLLPRWSHPTTFSHTVRKKMETLVETLSDSGRAMIPAFFPLTIDNKIVFRTMRGVTVVDANTGKALWETREGISPELIISGRGRPTASRYSRFNRVRFRSGSTGGRGDTDPLTGLLFRDGTFGNISSDGERLFVIEEHAILSSQQPGYNYGDPEQSDAYRRSWKTNKLAAYDLNSGRPLWEIGGRQRNESFDLKLAGYYFFGTPVADRGELFLVGEKDSQIRVFAIDAETGNLKWSQLIAYSDTKISRDIGRRWFTSQVAVKDGMLICPTTVGWMVAVDRLNHSVLWAHRYSKTATRTRNRFGSNTSTMVPATPLNGRWTPSAPVITQGHVVYTPSEDASICCLNLIGGKPVWKIPKANYLYLAGVFGDNVVLVGREAVTAVSLTGGTTNWTLKIPPTSGRPSGMGVAADGSYHLPLSTGQLWSIELATGKIQNQLYLTDPTQPLGNLAMYRGMLLSLNPFRMSSFEQRAAIVEKIKQRKAQSPDDAWALLREVEILHLERDYVASLALLRRIQADKLTADMTDRYHNAMILSLTNIIRSDLRQHDTEVKELEKFSKSKEERFAFRRLAAERYDARGELDQAFEIYRTLVAESPARKVQRADTSGIEVSVDRWVAGRIHDIYDRADANLKKQIDATIVAQAKAVPANDVAAQQRFCTVYGFHSAASPILSRLAESYASSQRFGRAEQLLLDESRRPDRAVAASAVARLADLLRTRGYSRDASIVYQRLATEFAKDQLSDGRTVQEYLAALKQKGVSIESPKRNPVSWGGTKMVLEPSGTRYTSNSVQELSVTSGRAPYFRDHRFQLDVSQQQLSVVNTENNTLDWLVPLRGTAGGTQTTLYSASASGHCFFLLHRGVVHCLSPVDKRILWTRPLESRGGTAVANNPFTSSYSSSSNGRLESMWNGQTALSRMALTNNATMGAYVPIANGKYIGVYGRRKFTIIDAMTGETMWEFKKLPAGTRFMGVRNFLIVVPTKRESAYAVRASDGKRVELKNIAKLIETGIEIVGNHILQLDVKTSSFLGLRRETMTLRLTDPVSGDSIWSRSFKAGAAISRAHDGSLIVLTKEGRLELIDTTTGVVRSTAQVAQTDLRGSRQIYAVADSDNLTLIINSGSRSGSVFYSGGMSTVSVHGKIIGFDRDTGRQLWKQKINNRNLVVQYLTYSPVLTFSSRKYIRQGRTSYQSMRMMAIDKRSGDRLIDIETPTNQYYRALNVNVPGRYVEFESYNHRLRLTVVDQKPGKQPPAGKPAVSAKATTKTGT